jgi:eukaryotic-like serine/threonine-protein kinase
MALPSGTKLGPYEIQSAIGAGGMGEVYRAKDTRLDRTVAVKILPSHLSGNPEAKQRFDREARTISSLNHPNICTLHDVGHQDGTDFLVMEYLEGETLADRLKKGPLSPEPLLRYGIEICEGLEKAHKSGVIHRDLKPGNIMLTKSGAKLMDFGLAKAMPANQTPASSLTMTFSGPSADQPLTTQGTVVGTFQYMSPEQVEGKEADARSDIFALGAVLYEMATGKRAFEGKTTASVIAAVLERDPPPVSTVQPMSPPALDRVVKTCLAKDPDERFQNVHDVKLQLKWIAEGGSQAGVPVPIAARRKNREKLAWSLMCGFAVLAVILAAWTYLRPRSAGPGPVLAFVPPPTDTRFLAFGFGSGPVVVSPDETKLAFTAIDQNGSIKLWTRSLKASDAAAIPGTDGAAAPFWSPDSRSLGFFAGGKLKTVELNGGNLQVLADSSSPSASAWAPDGTILFNPASNSPLSRISAAGGKAVPFAVLGATNDYSDYDPAILPDGKHTLIVITDKNQHRRVELRSLTSPETKVVVDDAGQPAYAGGFLFFIRNQKIFAQSFDPASGKVSGRATPLADADWYSVAGRSVLAFQGVSRETRLQWFDLSGNPLGTIGQVAFHLSPKIAPDGKQVLFLAGAPPNDDSMDLWSVPTAGGVSTRMTFGPGGKRWSVWSPDGKYIAYATGSGGKVRIVRKPSDGSGAEETLLTLGPEISSGSVVDWSPDGRYLSYDVFDINKGSMANWGVPLFGDKKPFQPAPVAGNQYDGNFSPDGHWLAYFSSETGQPEVYVVPFPGPGGKYQISHGGGWVVRWDKKADLFFLSIGNQLMKAELNLNAQSLQVKSLRPLAQMNILDTAAPLFDVTADGQRVLAVTPARAESSSISLLLNWPALLNK